MCVAGCAPAGRRIRLNYIMATAAPPAGRGAGSGGSRPTNRRGGQPSGAHGALAFWHAPGWGLAVRARRREAARHGRDFIVPADCSLQQDDYCLEGPSQLPTGGAASMTLNDTRR